jgi:hypothetical protein
MRAIPTYTIFQVGLSERKDLASSLRSGFSAPLPLLDYATYERRIAESRYLYTSRVSAEHLNNKKYL